MTITSVAQWSTDQALNTDVAGNDIAEGCSPAGINNAIRYMMAQIAATAIAEFGTVALLIADTTKTYSNTTAGDYIRTRAEGFAYLVAASGASDHHVATGGGLKLYAMPTASGYSAKSFGAVGDGVTDDNVELQAFFDFLKTAGQKTAVIDGDFLTTVPLILDLESAGTSRIDWNCTIRASGSSDDYLLTITKAVNTAQFGKIELLGTGSSTYSTRTWRHGAYIEGCQASSFNANVTCRYFKENAVRFIAGIGAGNGNGALASLGKLRALYCGSIGDASAVSAASTTFSARSDTGSSATIGQRTILTVAALPDCEDVAGTFAKISGVPYPIVSVDAGASTITLQKWLHSGATTGTIDYTYGHGLYVSGADANMLGIDSFDAFVCGVGLRHQGFYAGTTNRAVMQSCGVGMTSGSPTASLSLQHTVINPYFELNTFDIVNLSIAESHTVIINPVALDLAKCFGVAPRVSATYAAAPAYPELYAFKILKDGKWLSSSPVDYADGTSPPATDLRLDDHSSIHRVIRSNTHTLRFKASTDLPRLFGMNTVSASVFGTGSNNAPSGTLTLNHEVGYTINGASGDVVLSPKIPVRVDARLFGTDWRVIVTSLGDIVDTGWSQFMTGTAEKTVALATFAAGTANAAYVQAEAQAVRDALQANSRRLKALEDAIKNAGIIKA